jgi:hypothetical protein
LLPPQFFRQKLDLAAWGRDRATRMKQAVRMAWKNLWLHWSSSGPAVVRDLDAVARQTWKWGIYQDSMGLNGIKWGYNEIRIGIMI